MNTLDVLLLSEVILPRSIVRTPNGRMRKHQILPMSAARELGFVRGHARLSGLRTAPAPAPAYRPPQRSLNQDGSGPPLGAKPSPPDAYDNISSGIMDQIKSSNGRLDQMHVDMSVMRAKVDAIAHAGLKEQQQSRPSPSPEFVALSQRVESIVVEQRKLKADIGDSLARMEREVGMRVDKLNEMFDKMRSTIQEATDMSQNAYSKSLRVIGVVTKPVKVVLEDSMDRKASIDLSEGDRIHLAYPMCDMGGGVVCMDMLRLDPTSGELQSGRVPIFEDGAYTCQLSLD